MKAAAVLSLIPAVSAFCHHGTSLFKRAEGTYGFDAMNGPLNWHSLTPNNSACALGKNQSPINVLDSNTKQVQGSTITFAPADYPQGTELENLNGVLEVRANGTMSNGGKDYTLRQFHFHTPSEHRINGEHYPLEVHFVWESEAGNGSSSLAVVGFLIEVAETTDPILAAIFKNVDQVKTVGAHAATGPLDFSALSSHLSKSTIYQYSGSLTTPPCTESIAWNVVGTPINIDIATYKKAKGIMKFNSRYTQNNPGEMNLLENAMVSLQKIVGEQGADPAPERPCKKGKKHDRHDRQD
ncbi:carbonic anhydrase [Colletotrichum karsti]|uniref:Carbonic anhydrase n=1 Tax=Colletotrichum karsti TaxID=1095194 RepID=A0A9P6I8U5_9PEZI|nr:carbonic anhydrase [Colletotrichum karsti]KAF9878090.1 carbonic anhydrase [Colletotrichum karsti]